MGRIQHERFNVGNIKPDFGLLTSTPVMSRRIPANHKKLMEIQKQRRPSCQIEFSLSQKSLPPASSGMVPTESKRMRKYSTPYDIATPPVVSQHELSCGTIVSHGQTGSRLSSEDEDDIPDEIQLPTTPTTMPKQHSSTAKPFSPGEDEERNLPNTPGSACRTKKTLDSATYQSTIGSILEEQSAGKALLHPLSGVMKRPSQFQRVEEVKESPGSQPTISFESSPTMREAKANFPAMGKKIKAMDVSRVRKNLLLESQ